jgi:hypothetical protein
MPLNVELKDITRPQRSATLTTRPGGTPGAFADQRLLLVFTGWVGATHSAGGDLTRNIAISFVANPDRTVQTFKSGNQDLGQVEAIVVAGLSSFGGDPDVAAVDQVTVGLEPRTFPGVGGQPLVLILRATLAAQDGSVHAFGYQVTVLAHPSLLDATLTLPASTHP